MYITINDRRIMMKKTLKTLTIMMVFIIGLLWNMEGPVLAKEVGVKLNGQRLSFNDQTGYPVIIKGKAYAPIKSLSQALNAQLKWNQQSKTATMIYNGVTLQIPIGKGEISINQQRILTGQANELINSRCYIPLGIFGKSDEDGIKVLWNQAEYCVELTTEVAFENKKDNNLQLRGISIGDTKEQLISKLGEAGEVRPSLYGFQWFIYHDDYKNYVQVGLKDNRVVALYTNADYWNLEGTLRYGIAKEELAALWGNPKQDYSLKNALYYIKETNKIIFYLDQHDNNKAKSVLIIDQIIEESAPLYINHEETALLAYEKQVFDLANVERVKRGLGVLKWDVKVAEIARDHSKDMQKNNYFNHNSLDGRSPFVRAKNKGILYRAYGENIAMGQRNPIEVLHSWMNSEGHRRNILNEKYSGLGVGIWNDESNGQPYYTQNFIAYR